MCFVYASPFGSSRYKADWQPSARASSRFSQPQLESKHLENGESNQDSNESEGKEVSLEEEDQLAGPENDSEECDNAPQSFGQHRLTPSQHQQDDSYQHEHKEHQPQQRYPHPHGQLQPQQPQPQQLQQPQPLLPQQPQPQQLLPQHQPQQLQSERHKLSWYMYVRVSCFIALTFFGGAWIVTALLGAEYFSVVSEPSCSLLSNHFNPTSSKCPTFLSFTTPLELGVDEDNSLEDIRWMHILLYNNNKRVIEKQKNSAYVRTCLGHSVYTHSDSNSNVSSRSNSSQENRIDSRISKRIPRLQRSDYVDVQKLVLEDTNYNFLEGIQENGQSTLVLDILANVSSLSYLYLDFRTIGNFEPFIAKSFGMEHTAQLHDVLEHMEHMLQQRLVLNLSPVLIVLDHFEHALLPRTIMDNNGLSERFVSWVFALEHRALLRVKFLSTARGFVEFLRERNLGNWRLSPTLFPPVRKEDISAYLSTHTVLEAQAIESVVQLHGTNMAILARITAQYLRENEPEEHNALLNDCLKRLAPSNDVLASLGF